MLRTQNAMHKPKKAKLEGEKKKKKKKRQIEAESVKKNCDRAARKMAIDLLATCYVNAPLIPNVPPTHPMSSTPPSTQDM
jgi:hypothetical protein